MGTCPPGRSGNALSPSRRFARNSASRRRRSRPAPVCWTSVAAPAFSAMSSRTPTTPASTLISRKASAIDGLRAETLSAHLAERAGYYDAVCCFEVIEHVRDPRRLFAEMVLAAKPNGLLCVGVPHVPSALTRIPNYLDRRPAAPPDLVDRGCARRTRQGRRRDLRERPTRALGPRRFPPLLDRALLAPQVSGRLLSRGGQLARGGACRLCAWDRRQRDLWTAEADGGRRGGAGDVRPGAALASFQPVL